MRTTIVIPDDLLRGTRELAAKRATSVSRVIADALRAELATRAEPSAEPVTLACFSGSPPGTLPGVDLDDSAALLEILDSA